MKKFSKLALFLVLVLVVGMTMSACSKSSSSSGTSSTSSVSTISTGTQGRQAAASSTQSASMSQGSGQTFRNLGNVGLSATGTGVPEFPASKAFKATGTLAKVEKVTAKFAKSESAMAAARAVKRAASAAKAAVASASTFTGSGACTDGGTFSYTVSAPTASSFTADIDFNSCRESDSQMGGRYHLAATEAATSVSLNITLGTTAIPFTIFDYSAGYSALIAGTSMTAFSLTETVSATASSITLDMAADGTMSYHDYFTNEDFSIQFLNGYDQAVSISTVGTGTAMTSITLDFTTNGDFKEVWSAASVTHTVTASFSALKLDLTLGALTSTPTATVPYEEMTLDGQFSITFSPETCMNGTFKFVTNTAIRASMDTGKTYQGKLTINDVTTITFNADGTVTVVTTAATTDTKTYSNKANLADECPIAEMGGDTAPSSTEVTSNGTYTGTGGVTITLTWDKVNDMDLHLAHWVTKPTGTATIPSISSTGVTTNSDWHLYFGTGPGYACSTGNYIGTSTNMIAELDIDKCSSEGYGPEHITMATPPTGYYIVFVDAYSASEATLNNLSIQIGDKIYTFPAHTFASSSDANWIAGAFSVDSSGVVTVTSAMANTINYTGAMRAPKF